ncbi:MAG TPA: hypothetical protein EYH07_13355, partial [Kiloniellaceae bacterium]|nr:hypothetical protein [Kiloniellaceae bacterium]
MSGTLRSLFALSLLLLPALAAAKERPFLDEPRPMTDRTDIEEPEYWKEGATQLPPYPPDEGLQPVEVDEPDSQFRYFIDPGSLSIGKDEVVRYTLIIESKAGARNISYEGMRCDAHQYKTYAFGSSGRWTPLREPRWLPIRETERFRYD